MHDGQLLHRTLTVHIMDLQDTLFQARILLEMEIDKNLDLIGNDVLDLFE